jgi:putative endonuclease
MSWFLYIVECADGSLYTGITCNITRRIKEHNTSNKLGSKFTRVRRPVSLVYTEQLKSKSQALRRELEIKSWSRLKKLNLIKKA